MRPLSHIDQIAFADLCATAFEARFDGSFPANGNIVRQVRGGRSYLYYKGYERATQDAPGKHRLVYVGPADDPVARARAESFARDKDLYRLRRELAGKLRRSGLPAPTAVEGRILEALAGAWDRVVLVGTLAYQSYAGPLATLLDAAAYRTQDADFAELTISAARETIDLSAVLQRVDPTFAPIFHPAAPSMPVGFRNRSGYKVELLVPQERAQQPVYASRVMAGVGAQALKDLDFLVKDPIRSVVLHEAGVPVMVPAPERYAVHKLILTCLRARDDQGKIAKDIAQAGAILEAKRRGGMTVDLGLAWTEAYDRGPEWRRFLALGAARLPEEGRANLADGVRTLMRIEGGDPARYIPWLGADRGGDGAP